MEVDGIHLTESQELVYLEIVGNVSQDGSCSHMERVPVVTAKIQLPILSMENEQQYLSSLCEGLATPTLKRTQCK